MTRNIYLGLGSNVGDRFGFLKSALDAIDKIRGTSVVRVSSIYETEPVGKKDQPEFLNLAAALESDLKAEDLLQQLKSTEIQLGRTRSERWGPREIDIDILYYGDRIIRSDSVQIPHAEVANRRFVLLPLVEIAPMFEDPRRKLTVSELLKRCPDQSAVRKTGFSAQLQEH